MCSIKLITRKEIIKIQLPKTTMFKNITITDYMQSDYIKKFCSFCGKPATKIITRTSIHTDNRQIIFICNCCFEIEIKGIRKYMRREAD
jgi:hypothetical protein